MRSEPVSLPSYPAVRDLYTVLRENRLPTLIYGMGNGADKLLARLAQYGIPYDDFFASDAFVRGHSFHGKRVLSFSEVRQKYERFRILLSFASHRPDVLNILYAMADEYPFYMPDLPVSGEGTFTKDFYNQHYKEICAVDTLLADESSKVLYRNLLHYKLSGDIHFLRRNTISPVACYRYFDPFRVHTAIDAGAYTGDTILEMTRIFPELSHIYGIEPDLKNYKRLCQTLEKENLIGVTPINVAVGSQCGEARFSESGNRNATFGDGSYQKKTVSVPVKTIDSLFGETVIDYIKFDVEGAEKEALLGSLETLRRCRPYLTVSAYHRNEDIFVLPLFLKENLQNYNWYYCRTECLPAWEIRLIGVPAEKAKEVGIEQEPEKRT